MSTTQDTIQSLVDRVERLEDDLEEERREREKEQRRRRQLERAVAESEVEFQEEFEKVRNKYDRKSFNTMENVFELEERVEKIEKGEVDPGEVVANSNAGIDPSDLLPLHNMYLSAQNLEPNEHDLSNNQEIAARLFPYLGQYAYSNEGQMILPSTKVQDIIEREISTPELAKRLDVESPNANTVRRAMKFVGKFGKDMMEFDDSEKTNQILIDRDAWVDYTREVSEVANSGDYDGVNTEGESAEVQDSADEEVEEELEQLTEGVITVS